MLNTFLKPEGCFLSLTDARMETTVKMHALARTVSACDVPPRRIVFGIALGLAVNKPLGQVNPSLHPRKNSPRTKIGQQKPRHQEPSLVRRKRLVKNKPSAKTGKVDFDDAENDVPEQEDTQEWTEEPDEPEVYFADGQTSESEGDVGCMPDWSCKRERGLQSVCVCSSCVQPHLRQPPSFFMIQSLWDSWEWHGPCCLVRARSQVRRCLYRVYTPTWEESVCHCMARIDSSG